MATRTTRQRRGRGNEGHGRQQHDGLHIPKLRLYIFPGTDTDFGRWIEDIPFSGSGAGSLVLSKPLRVALKPLYPHLSARRNTTTTALLSSHLISRHPIPSHLAAARRLSGSRALVPQHAPLEAHHRLHLGGAVRLVGRQGVVRQGEETTLPPVDTHISFDAASRHVEGQDSPM